MATFNELYASIFGTDEVKSQYQKKEKLIAHYNGLIDKDIENQKIAWNKNFKALTKRPEYKALNQEVTNTSAKLSELESEMARLDKVLTNNMSAIEKYVTDAIGPNPGLYDIKSKRIDPKLSENIQMVERLYRLDRD